MMVAVGPKGSSVRSLQCDEQEHPAISLPNDFAALIPRTARVRQFLLVPLGRFDGIITPPHVEGQPHRDAVHKKTIYRSNLKVHFGC